MKIKILKESRKKQEQLEEALRDYILGGTLALGSMFGGAKSAQAGVEGYSPETVELATAFAKALEDLQIVNKPPELEKKTNLNQEAQGLLNVIDNFLKNANQKDLEWAKNLIKKNKNTEIKTK